MALEFERREAAEVEAPLLPQLELVEEPASVFGIVPVAGESAAVTFPDVESPVLEPQATLSDEVLATEAEKEEPIRTGRIRKVARDISLLSVAASTYIFEQSPANEAIRAAAGVEILQHTSNPVLVGLAVGGITMGIETASGIATAATISVEDGMLGRFNKWVLNIAGKLKGNNKKGQPVGDAILALGGGATPVVAKRHAERGGRTFAENRNTAIKAAGGIAIFSGVLAGSAGEIIQFAAERGHAVGAQEALDIIADSKTWLGLYVGGLALSLMKKGVGKAYKKLNPHDWKDTLPTFPSPEVVH